MTTRPAAAPLESCVFRLPRDVLDRLRALSERTRVRQSEYLREAFADLLRKYADELRRPDPPRGY